jgi:hypothetical protein
VRRVPTALWLLLPLAAIGAGAFALSFAGARAGVAIAPPSEPAGAPAPTTPDDGSTAALLDAGGSPTGAITRIAPDGAILAPPEGDHYACLQPDLAIVREAACDRGRAYPHCRWLLPSGSESGGLYRIWRSTTPDHRWARPALVSLVLAAAREYQERWPGERLTIGDLDAAGPRHQTHDRGVDVDLYLEHAMIAANIGGGRYPDNYEGKPAAEVALLRARVLDLARILATCSRGRLRIYYNDPEVVDALRSWFDARGLVSDVGPPMVQHNPLHRFHFHMTIAEDLEPLPVDRREEAR